ncbi:MAG: dephospho-CoA kinase [Candidatus Muproteobacteria bacterium RIFCSPHIGHO2_12_FULL_60_33]|uniref:Dephospho-CoA kinase n=1 Tax=Candidatus Muproteobacteria bacterium RIFCSPLOWO2_01_FULL_60_18 TaxID=1817768 RepID=A0A1F6TXP2_9PROT|nr:MAG: dephospho-CoA kinase [Candidatus Muproteobacteria bacterium RIFCSPLOWO2_01_FULL_60_18]OGI50590.1 MAG: dephospho-CoA kinase [Candidatus Muproteobacteria bacterium RIFCSPHIGHO2_01_60_12]OGI53847.1 MAG: dephospho-CoA kinase [Candidatus Muproteobacteria bacterium RIFCSPHIGHO2_02_FULL_60_13]OGI56302.1 MAG: dephospho-CoA kinase [Candidatus Muproteobacteria bacterium RIFCSPHIGHO2_12_FULL_60_33]OGI58502.1 MAG: dephospho-CoA kinase [Candidatus Muproteobacteria bacterium RIFCSPHIGHO2_01_FULL_61_2
MLRVGLTGGIGSGKSTIAALFVMRGVPVIDTDEIARGLTEPGQETFDEIVRAFGDTILDENRRIDRHRLRERVFDNTDERRRLETILHPRIRAIVREKLAALETPYGIVVVPLLIESGFSDLVDRVLVVDAMENVQIQRTASRSGLSEPEIRKIMSAQISRAQRLQQANDVIENNGDRKQLEAEVERMHQWYLSLATTTKKTDRKA